MIFETPTMKIVKTNQKWIEENIPTPNFLSDAFSNFYRNFVEAYNESINQFIIQLSETHNLSYECAKYCTEKYFRFTVGIENENEKCYLVLIPHFIYQDFDSHNECEKELFFF